MTSLLYNQKDLGLDPKTHITSQVWLRVCIHGGQRQETNWDLLATTPPPDSVRDPAQSCKMECWNSSDTLDVLLWPLCPDRYMHLLVYMH